MVKKRKPWSQPAWAKPLTTSELATAVGVHPATIRRLERRGVVHAVRDFRGWRAFPPSEVQRLRELLGWPATDRGQDVGPPPQGVGAGR